MGTSGWAVIKSIYLETERIGQRYMLNMGWHIGKSLHNPRGNEGFQMIEHFTPDEAEKLGNALCYWAETEKESGREILEEIPEDIIEQRWGNG